MSKFPFGTPVTTTASTGFGFGAQKTNTGFTLGSTPLSTTNPTVGSGLTFGTPASTTTMALNPSFCGTSATQAQSNLLLGSNVTTSTSSLFSTPISSAAASTGLTFGTPGTTSSLNFGNTSITPVTGSLGLKAPVTTAPSLFGSAPTGGLFGAKPITTSTTTVATTVNKGLGGLDVSISNKGLSQGSNSPTAAKENLLPSELVQTIDNFKAFVKMQKSFSSDIARGSARPLNRCAEDTASLMEMLTSLAGSVQRDRSLADKLKHDTAKALQSAEIAQRTHDTPAGLQYENNAPLLFFMELAEHFEHDLMLFRSQIEVTEKHIQTMMAPKTLTPQELTMAMRKLHDSLVAVAGKLQGVHAKVQQQKEQYLNLRKYVLKDSTNVFEDIKINGRTSKNNFGKVTSGPTPFGPGNKTFLSSTALSCSRTPSYGTPNPLGKI
ncbi:probable nucleoporin Nup58 isoform X2 [Orussus abietinus]|uniref:probable nucleoporin Nup58 isoform X2 n=1 Tax=Orussus abietinus TaxID=222816 RepID=UPI0006265A34|nr:probable nucleoporin Nup58 isoform X2 [Orussus abietinus]